MTTEHTVKSFDEELKRLQPDLVAQMGGLAEAQLQAAIEALVSARRRAGGARSCRATPASTSSNARSAPRPSACWRCASRWRDDLREIVAALKISSDIERIGDYAANVAKRAIALTQSPPMRPVGGIAAHGPAGAADHQGRARRL